MRRLVEDAGLDGQVVVDSAGIGGWHAGEDTDQRAAAALRARGYLLRRHRARQFQPDDFTDRDLVVALDTGHERALRRFARRSDDLVKVRLLRSYDPQLSDGDVDVPDPYYGGDAGFQHVLDLIEAGCRGLLDEVRASLPTS